MHHVRPKFGIILAAVLLLTIAPIFMRTGYAATTNNAALPRALVSFTFDDSLASTYTAAAPILANAGLSGTDYAITGCMGLTTVPNTCRANTDVPYMTWAQLQALQNTYGWEIGSHTVDHNCLASNAQIDPSDCQTNTLTTAQVDAELANSKAGLAAHGIQATDISPPYGDFNNSVLAEIAKYYASMRQFKNASSNANVWPYSDYYLQDINVQEGINTVSQLESQINTAIANKQWLILTFHSIDAKPSTNPDDYDYGTAELQQLAAYVKTKVSAAQLQSVHINQGIITDTTNLLANGTFDSGITAGWHTDAPTNITKDSGNNGSYPSPTNAIKLVSGNTNNHLFSPLVSVDPGTTYLLKTFLNVKQITNGEVGFYIDEYDANGNWISGQWKTAERSSFVEDINFAYTPSSANVSKASLQIYTTSTPGITAYIDNAQWLKLTSTTVPTNLVPNGTFDSGITAGWHTDAPTNIIADTSNNGSPNNPVNSVKISTSSTNAHLFSPIVPVNPAKKYSLSTYVNLKAITSGEVGFYIDEYDANGNWISGQYVPGDHTVGASNVNFAYTPSSANVSKASLQIIVVGNSGIQGYVDDARWYTAN